MSTLIGIWTSGRSATRSCESRKRHGASNVRLFGSLIRGEDRPDSDIDPLVDMAADRSLLDLIGLGQELEAVLDRQVDAAIMKDERFYRGHIRDAINDIHRVCWRRPRRIHCPTPPSVVRLFGAILLEQDDEWAVAERGERARSAAAIS